MRTRHALALLLILGPPADALDRANVPSCPRSFDADASSGSCLSCHASDRAGSVCGLDFLPPDAGTERCVACHAEGHARAPQLRGGASHPVDFPYEGGGRRGSGALKSKAHVLARLHLPEGRLTCTTCHDARTREPFRLARPLDGPNWRERLCNVCHALGDDDDLGGGAIADGRASRGSVGW